MILTFKCLEVHPCFCSCKIMTFFSNREIFQLNYVFLCVFLAES